MQQNSTAAEKYFIKGLSVGLQGLPRHRTALVEGMLQLCGSDQTLLVGRFHAHFSMSEHAKSTFQCLNIFHPYPDAQYKPNLARQDMHHIHT